MSEYIHTNKFDTNECQNIFVKEKLIRMNVRIYICDQYIPIFEYIRHTLLCNWFCLYILLSSLYQCQYFGVSLRIAWGFYGPQTAPPSHKPKPSPPPHPTETISWVPFQQLVVHSSAQFTQCSVQLAVIFVLHSIYFSLPFGWWCKAVIAASNHSIASTSAGDRCTSNVPPPTPIFALLIFSFNLASQYLVFVCAQSVNKLFNEPHFQDHFQTIEMVLEVGGREICTPL